MGVTVSRARRRGSAPAAARAGPRAAGQGEPPTLTRVEVQREEYAPAEQFNDAGKPLFTRVKTEATQVSEEQDFLEGSGLGSGLGSGRVWWVHLQVNWDRVMAPGIE